MTFWFTGLSGAGKSTLAFALEKALADSGYRNFVLDGDHMREGLNKNLGFSFEDRRENIRRISEVSKLMNDAGLIVITALISPLKSDREMAKNIIGENFFREIYVSTPLQICQNRDPKGLYKKASTGLIKNFTGISAPYEPPFNPALIVDTSNSANDKVMAQLLAFVKKVVTIE